MNIKEYKSYNEMCKYVAEQIKYAINFNFMSEYFTLGLATGSTPIGIYTNMVADGWDTSKVYTFNLDEYADISLYHSQSYRTFMHEHLFRDKKFRQSFFPTEENYRNYDVMIQRFPIDIQILGIGN